VQLALKLTILTGVRPRVARECHLDHIDGDVWTVPGDSMKGRKNRTPDFRIPLTAEALKVIEAAKAFERDGFIFASQRGRNVITDAGVSKYVREVRELPYKVHGFRSSLRTWADAETDAPFEIKEMLLAHKERNQTARAYIRTDYLDERRALLERWGEHCQT
jgi:integrase